MSPTLGVTAADASRPVADANAASDAEQHKHRCAAIRTPDAVYLALTLDLVAGMNLRMRGEGLHPCEQYPVQGLTPEGLKHRANVTRHARGLEDEIGRAHV